MNQHTELIAQLQQTNQFHDNADVTTAQIVDAIESLTKQLEADCRTCHYYASLEGCFNTMHNELRGVVCTNGDQYKQAPSVVLWRTE
jgi:frataxin-like iron-binding protein CyaY